MGKMVLEFKAKMDGDLFKFPMLSKRHVVEGAQGCGCVSRYFNSTLFDEVLNRHLRKDLGIPVGLHCWLGDIAPANPCLTFKPGFLHTFRIEFED